LQGLWQAAGLPADALPQAVLPGEDDDFRDIGGSSWPSDEAWSLIDRQVPGHPVRIPGRVGRAAW